MPASHSEAVVTTDRRPARSTTARQLAPFGVGALVMLVATLAATVVRPWEDRSVEAAAPANAIVEATDQATAAAPPPSAEPTPTPAPTTTTPAPAPAPPAAAQGPSEQPAPATRRSQESRAAAAAPRSGGGGEGRRAAAVHNWTLVGGDEFNGGMSPNWSPYDGPGHAGNGRRTPDAITVQNGMLVIRGDAEGNTGGMSWQQDQRFGRWEVRARFPKGDDQYHPVLILWRESGGKENGEIDFAETTSASDKVSFFLHYGSEQDYAHKSIDLTQWHNYAVEWVDGRVTGYIDGEKWFESTDREKLPPGQMHPTIQLDYFPEDGSPQPTEMHVDYMRIYR